MKVVIDGIEYVPKSEVPELTDERLKQALQSLTEIQYFSEETHEHRAWAWDALHVLSPQLAALSSKSPEAAWESLRSDYED